MACILPAPETQDDGIYHVYALRFAKAPERRAHDNFVFRDPHDGPMPMDFFVWILHNRHRTVLVDTGFGARAAAERHRPLDVDPVEALDRLGLPAPAIEHIILTHLHFDHAGNIGRFPNARLHVQDAEVGFATGRCMCEAFLRMPFDIEDVVDMIRHTYAGRVAFHDGDAAPLPGITLHLLPGHTRGTQAVKVMTPRGPVLLASDVSHYFANFLRRSPFRITVETQETLQSYSSLLRIAGSVDRIIPGHDPKVRWLYQQEGHAGLDLSVLHEAPRPHTVEDLVRAGE